MASSHTIDAGASVNQTRDVIEYTHGVTANLVACFQGVGGRDCGRDSTGPGNVSFAQAATSASSAISVKGVKL